jgi:hypothetical protein
MSRWKFVTANGERLYDVGIEGDGTLWNPNGYSEELVRASILAAEERRRAKRSAAAVKATATRQRRHARRAHEMARRFAEGENLGLRVSCACCGRHLSDEESIARGIGSECWQWVLSVIAETGEGNFNLKVKRESP